MAAIAENLQLVRARLARFPRVKLLAVSKSQDVERIRAAHDAGQDAFGENYVQEAVQKMQLLPKLEWHLIGPLQSNKTRVAAEHFDWVQTVASEKVARRLSEQRPPERPALNILIQVNVSAEGTKSGLAPAHVEALARSVSAMPRVRLRGLMAIPAPGADRSAYRGMKQLYDSLQLRFAFDTLSMGMSDDLDLALEEGATMVRVGTAIFGPRNRQQDAA
jgi:pyridoxal phosphate enzyme (YggS family)